MTRTSSAPEKITNVAERKSQSANYEAKKARTASTEQSKWLISMYTIDIISQNTHLSNTRKLIVIFHFDLWDFNVRFHEVAYN